MVPAYDPNSNELTTMVEVPITTQGAGAQLNVVSLCVFCSSGGLCILGTNFMLTFAQANAPGNVTAYFQPLALQSVVPWWRYDIGTGGPASAQIRAFRPTLTAEMLTAAMGSNVVAPAIAFCPYGKSTAKVADLTRSYYSTTDVLDTLFGNKELVMDDMPLMKRVDVATAINTATTDRIADAPNNGGQPPQ